MRNLIVPSFAAAASLALLGLAFDSLVGETFPPFPPPLLCICGLCLRLIKRVLSSAGENGRASIGALRALEIGSASANLQNLRLGRREETVASASHNPSPTVCRTFFSVCALADSLSQRR